MSVVYPSRKGWLWPGRVSPSTYHGRRPSAIPASKHVRALNAQFARIVYSMITDAECILPYAMLLSVDCSSWSQRAMYCRVVADVLVEITCFVFEQCLIVYF